MSTGLPYEFIKSEDQNPTQNENGSWSFDRVVTWNLYGLRINDFLFAKVLPARGSVHPTWPFYVCVSKSVSDIRELAGSDARQVDIRITYRTAKLNEYNPYENADASGSLYPWYLPAQNYSVSGQDVEQTLREIYDDNGNAIPMVNSAGSPILVNGTRAQSSIRFEYYRPMSGFDENFVHDFKNTVNNDDIRVAGLWYPRLMLRCDSLSATVENATNSDGTTAYSYWKIAAQLSADPETFWRKYLNVGTMHRPISSEAGQVMSPVPTWTATDSSGNVRYGSRQEMLDISEENAEPINEPMFLNPDGTLATIGDDGKQEPVYLNGIPEFPVDFSILGMPTEKT